MLKKNSYTQNNYADIANQFIDQFISKLNNKDNDIFSIFREHSKYIYNNIEVVGLCNIQQIFW